MATPPSGHGVYARAQSVAYLSRFDFVALNADRGDVEQKALHLKDAGKRVYLYTTPGRWTPSTWPVGRITISRKARRLQVAGYIADPENGWGEVATGTRNEMLTALGRLLAEDAASGLDVGVTSFPLFPGLAALAEGCGGKVWGNPQLYKDRPAADLRSFMDRWRSEFGDFSVLLAAALWKNANSPPIHTQRGYAAYLEKLPRSTGVIGWTTNRNTEWMTQQFLAWQPGGSLPERAVLRIGSMLSSTEGIIMAIVIVLAIASVVAWWT